MMLRGFMGGRAPDARFLRSFVVGGHYPTRRTPFLASPHPISGRPREISPTVGVQGFPLVTVAPLKPLHSLAKKARVAPSPSEEP
jgi:hypothetical protein